MKEENKVIHLCDVITQEQEVKTISRHHKLESLEQPESHLVKRAIALGVDIMAIGVIKTAIDGGYALFVSQFLSPVSNKVQGALISGNMALHFSIFIAIFWTYFLYTSFILNGKTLGKMALGLRVIDENFVRDREQLDYELSFRSSMRRALGYLLCYSSFGTFFIFNFSSEDKRGLPDYLSGSRTVSEDWLKQTLEHRTYAPEEVFIDINSLDKQAA